MTVEDRVLERGGDTGEFTIQQPESADHDVSRGGRDAFGSGKRWVGKRVDLGKCGPVVGKWCSFSHFRTALPHLFPHKSTQVVDFPHLAKVSQAGFGTIIGNGVVEFWSIGGAEWERWLQGGLVTGCYAFFHEVSRFYAQIMAVITRFCALLRVRLLFPEIEMANGKNASVESRTAGICRLTRAVGLEDFNGTLLYG